MSIADKLNYTLNAKNDCFDAIVEKGGEIDTQTTFGEFGDAIRSIPSGTNDDWQPHPDWFDIKQILADDVPPEGYKGRFIFLLADTDAVRDLNYYLGGTLNAIVRTSDGYTGNPLPAHIWNTSFDRNCSDGYKTRWIIIYTPIAQRDVSLVFVSNEVDNNNILWAFVDDANTIPSNGYGGCTFSDSTTSNKCMIECFESTDNTNSSGSGHVNNYVFANTNIVKCVFPTGTSYGFNPMTFAGCKCLKYITIPDNMIYLTALCFQGCSSLKYITIKGEGNLIFGQATFQQCPSFEGFIFESPLKTLEFANQIFNACSSLVDTSFLDRCVSTSWLANLFINCVSIKTVKIPAIVTSIATDVFQGTSNLTSVQIQPNWIPPLTGLILRHANYTSTCNLSRSGMIELLNNLGDNTGGTTIPIVFGALNIARLTAAEIAIGQNKNYTIS